MTLHENASDRWERYLKDLAREGYREVPEDAMCEISGLWLEKTDPRHRHEWIEAWERADQAITIRNAKANRANGRDRSLGDALDNYVRPIANADLVSIADDMDAGAPEPEMRNPFDDPVELVG